MYVRAPLKFFNHIRMSTRYLELRVLNTRCNYGLRITVCTQPVRYENLETGDREIPLSLSSLPRLKLDSAN